MYNHHSCIYVFYSLFVYFGIYSVLGLNPGMSNKRAILFDVDGTLSDSFQLGFSATQTVLKNNGFKAINEEDYHKGTRYTTPARLAWHSTGDVNDPIGVVLGKQFDDLYVQLVSTDTAPFYPGVSTLLSSLKSTFPDMKYGALSNACGAYVHSVLRVNGFTDDFKVALGADEVPMPKPHPDGLLQCCYELKMDPKFCVYVGDSPTDGQAAAAAGMPSVGVTWGSHPAKSVREAFTHTVETVEELQTQLTLVLSRAVE